MTCGQASPGTHLCARALLLYDSVLHCHLVRVRRKLAAQIRQLHVCLRL